ncbi:MAG: DUF5667 domain-containing protein [Pseudonocardiaceae bacterium]
MNTSIRDVSDHTLHRELTVVAALRQVGATVGPHQVERDRMRQRVMAGFTQACEADSSVLSLRAARSRRWFPDQTQGRVMVAAAASLCLLLSLSGMSVLLSRDALPGDALYSFKRTTESAELGLTFGDQPKALKHLDFASARVNEIEAMADQADASGNWSIGRGKFLRALDDFDSDTTAGARLLTGLAVSGQANSLSTLRGWAEQQKVRLSAIRAALPLPISARLDNTLGILDRVITRVSALSQHSSCLTMTSGSRDELGLLPARNACRPMPMVDQPATAVPLPEAPSTPAAIPPNLITPPSLLPPLSGNPLVLPSQKAESGHPGVSPTRTPGGVLSGPSSPRSEPSLQPQPLQPQPWSPLPKHDSPPPAAPLPPWILQPRLLPPG